MRTEADLRVALAGLVERHAALQGKPRTGVAYMTGIQMTVETLRWVLGETCGGPGGEHPYARLMKGQE